VGQHLTTAALAKALATYGGAVLIGWQLLGHIDVALVQHLDSTFATKVDIQRLEAKIDSLVEHSPRKP